MTSIAPTVDMTRPQRRTSRLPVTAHVVAALMILAIAVAYLAGQTFWLSVVARAAIFALAAVSLSFILGQGGLVNFGHAAPFGIGAYAALITGEAGITELLIVLPVAFLAAAAFAAATGAFALRTRGVYYIMITLAFAQMAYFTAASLSAYGGDDGMALAARSTLFGFRIFASDLGLALVSVLTMWGAALILERVTRSRFGVVLRGLKDNESRLAALGFAPFSYRLVAMAISAGIAGIAGALLANQTEFVAPAYMNWHRSGEFIVMVVLGGTGRLGGALIGAIGIVLLEEALGNLTEYWKLWLGLLLVAVVLGRSSPLAWLRRGSRDG